MPEDVFGPMTALGSAAVRTAAAEDIPVLKALWHTVFGDAMTDIDCFFDTFFSQELTAVIDDAQTPVAAAYAVPNGYLVLPDGGRTPCAMVYAVAAHPLFRGRGYGAAVSRAAGCLAVRAGFPAVVLKPADSGLFTFYEEHTDFSPFFYSYEFDMTPDQLPPIRAVAASPVTPAEYRQLRNRFLDGAVFIDADVRVLGYQERLSASSGGGLFALSDGSARMGCAIVEMSSETALVKELLLSGGCRPADAVLSLAHLLGAKRYRVRTPAAFGGSEGALTPFGMILPIPGLTLSGFAHYITWYGPAFD